MMKYNNYNYTYYNYYCIHQKVLQHLLVKLVSSLT